MLSCLDLKVSLKIVKYRISLKLSILAILLIFLLKIECFNPLLIDILQHFKVICWSLCDTSSEVHYGEISFLEFWNLLLYHYMSILFKKLFIWNAFNLWLRLFRFLFNIVKRRLILFWAGLVKAYSCIFGIFDAVLFLEICMKDFGTLGDWSLHLLGLDQRWGVVALYILALYFFNSLFRAFSMVDIFLTW